MRSEANVLEGNDDPLVPQPVEDVEAADTGRVVLRVEGREERPPLDVLVAVEIVDAGHTPTSTGPNHLKLTYARTNE